jgi:hypothetical protein
MKRKRLMSALILTCYLVGASLVYAGTILAIVETWRK